MPEQRGESCAAVENATPMPQASGATLHWDDSSRMCGAKELYLLPADRRRPSFQAKGLPVSAHCADPYWTTGQISHVPAPAPQMIAWEKEAALMTFALPPVLLAAPAHTALPGATGELVWLPWQARTASFTHAVHPALLVHAPDTTRQAECITIVPFLLANDPLLHHMALLQARRGEFERAWKAQTDATSRVQSYEPNYEGSPIVAGPPGGRCSAHGCGCA